MAIEIKIAKFDQLRPTANLAKASLGAIAYDIRVPESVILRPGRQIVKTNLCSELPINFEAKIEPRSGFSCKGFEGKSMFSGETKRFDCDVMVGKIDSDYRGEWGIMVNNHDEEFILEAGTRIAQVTFYEVPETLLKYVDKEALDNTERGDGGFGHSGTK